MIRKTLGVALVILAALPVSTAERLGRVAPDAGQARALSFEDRVAAQRAIEEVYWRHRIWPKENPAPKPSLEEVMPETAVRARVEDDLRKSNALEKYWRRPITAEQLQAEMDRMGASTRAPDVLREIFGALGNDPERIAETLARQSLADRLLRNWYTGDSRFHGGFPETGESSFDSWWESKRQEVGSAMGSAQASFTIPTINESACTGDTWRDVQFPSPISGHTAVWTGSEMIFWGGLDDDGVVNTGGRYNPSTDSWVRTSTGVNVPSSRSGHTAVWTGTEMIVWGGYYSGGRLNTGGRYDPATDRWLTTSIGIDVPSARAGHTAVWSGSEMIVWGGGNFFNTGGRYDPSADRWLPTSIGIDVPSARAGHTAVWSGSEMIVWGGQTYVGYVNTGGRYDPVTDRWLPTSIGIGVPPARAGHTVVWTGTEMVVWGGQVSLDYLNTGGRYDPTTDRWLPTSIGIGVPPARTSHTAVWTGSEMIVWGGWANTPLDTGGRYVPATDRWLPTSIGVGVPPARAGHTAVWTGNEMIVWGGWANTPLDTGGRYDPTADIWLPTSTSSSAPSARDSHTAVWTGSEMIVWGGYSGTSGLNTGGRYDPATDRWFPTSALNAPAARYSHTAIWTGSEMIVWGGWGGTALDSGGRYDPSTDRWLPTSTSVHVPAARIFHAAVWTGSEMIVWGGYSGTDGLDTGGRYDPAADSWLPTSTGSNVPSARYFHTAVWTGTEMIVWGGGGFGSRANTGGRYDPRMDRWLPTSTGTHVPEPRTDHTAVWTGREMIVWGGYGLGGDLNTGGRYNPATDSWVPTPIDPWSHFPFARALHTAVWTGGEMIVWGGYSYDTGGYRYDPVTDRWLSTSSEPYVPSPRLFHTAVWTGSEMIVWGGLDLNDGMQTDTGGRYCACPVSFPDADGDGYGTPAVWSVRCDGSIPPGYVSDNRDCDDSDDSVHPGVEEACNGVDDDCNGQVDEDPTGADADADLVGDACDNCPALANPDQADGEFDSTIVDRQWAVSATASSEFSPTHWGAVQATGPADSAGCGDYPSAWTPSSDGSEPEWLEVRFAAGIYANGLAIHETYLEGFVTGVDLIDVTGISHPVWSGPDSTSCGEQLVLQFPLTPYRVIGARIATAVDGFEEIDAVELIGYRAQPDGFGDACDNCPTASNSDQTDSDEDAVGDACDNCPTVHNPTQSLPTFYRDQDGDGHGDSTSTVQTCGAPEGYSASGGDCDDGDPAVHPGAAEACNGVDDDCNAVVDDGGSALCSDGEPCTADACTDGRCSSGPSTDADGDGTCSPPDNCPSVANPDQADTDEDGAGDACDPCPLDSFDDADRDEVCGNLDACPNSVLLGTVVLEGCDSRVPNIPVTGGCSLQDRVNACAVGAVNHGEFVSCVARLAGDLRGRGVLTGREAGRIQKCAARANPHPVHDLIRR